MKLLKLLRNEIKEPLKPVIWFIVLTSGSNALLVNLISRAADHVYDEQLTSFLFISYLGTGLLFLYTRSYIYDRSFIYIEDVVSGLQIRLGNKIRMTELSTLEKVGTASIHARLTEDMTYLSNIDWSLIRTIQACFVILAMLVYIAILSSWAFIFVFIGVAAAVLNYMLKADAMARNYFDLTSKETIFLQKLNHVLEGFKEMKISGQKSNQMFQHYRIASDERGGARVYSFQFYNLNTSFAYACLFISIATIVFVLPYYYQESSVTIIKITAAILFLFGPIESALNAIPSIAIAEYGAQNILTLEKELNTTLQNSQEQRRRPKQHNSPLLFNETIQLEALMYNYEHNNSKHPFSIGPMNITFNKGEIIFLTGGNGSGKSTFLKMLTGLYMPKSGRIYIDRDLENGKEGTLISSANYLQYSELYTTIFTDFHLFDKLYSSSEVDSQYVKKLLYRMGLPEEKTTYRNGGFTNIKLSSGQRKRLALVTSILENKDIYIFDEVASELDPEFRDTYYYEILQELRARNKTVLVVSHDKEYWEVADKVWVLKKGQFYALQDLNPTAIYQ